MKKLIFLLLLLSSELSAQRWTPVMLNDTFHYRKTLANAVAGSFYSTSFSQNSGDTLFQINRIGCTYCVTIQGGPAPCDTCYGLRNLPNLIAGYSINKTASGTCYFNSNDTALLETNAAVGHSWMFLPSLSISAQVISADTLTILGQPDSVKTAYLSNGDTVKWTAEHGILQWPAGWGTGTYYRLAGIQNRNQGYQLPELRDYYDFQPGDVLQYNVADYNASTGWGNMGTNKWVFTQRVNYSDSIVYSGIKMIFTSSSGPAYTFQVPFSFTVTVCSDHHTLITADSWSYPLQIQTMNYSMPSIVGCPDTTVPSPVGYIKQNYISSPSGVEGVEIGNDRFNFPGLWLNMPGNQDTLSGYIVDYNDNYASQYRIVYAKYLRGLGLVKHTFEEPLVRSRSEELTAYVKNGDTTGVILPDSFFQLGLADQELLLFHSFPNPANESLRIELSETSGPAQLELINLQGEILQRVSITQPVTTISTSELAAGLYLLRVQTAEGVSVQRVVIQH